MQCVQRNTTLDYKLVIPNLSRLVIRLLPEVIYYNCVVYNWRVSNILFNNIGKTRRISTSYLKAHFIISTRTKSVFYILHTFKLEYNAKFIYLHVVNTEFMFLLSQHIQNFYFVFLMHQLTHFSSCAINSWRVHECQRNMISLQATTFIILTLLYHISKGSQICFSFFFH